MRVELFKTLTAEELVQKINGYLPDDRQIKSLKKDDGEPDVEANQRLLNICNVKICDELFTEVVDILQRPDGLYLEVELASYQSTNGIVQQCTFSFMLEYPAHKDSERPTLEQLVDTLLTIGYEKV